MDVERLQKERDLLLKTMLRVQIEFIEDYDMNSYLLAWDREWYEDICSDIDYAISQCGEQLDAAQEPLFEGE